MPKPKKIKRYSSIYSRNKRRKNAVLKTLLTIIAFIAIAAIAFFVTSWALGSDHGDEAAPTEAVPSETQVVEEEQPPEPVVIPTNEIKAKELPASILADQAQIAAFAAQAKTEGYNTIMVPLKTDEGELLYASSIPEATAWQTISPTPVDASAIVQVIQDAGLMPMAQIYGFEDDLASSYKNGNTYIYKNATWLDNAKENGGKSWLNPYEDSARKYICDIVTELGGLGYREVLIDGVQFPDVSISKAQTNSNGVSQQAILQQFYQELNATGVPVIISYYWDTVTNGTSTKLYGGDPSTYTGVSSMAPIIDLSAYPNGVKTTQGQVKNTSGIVQYVIGKIQSQSSSVTIVPEIIAGQDAATIEQTLAALGINAYIVLS